MNSFLCVNFTFSLFIAIGCQRSNKSWEIFERAEMKNSKLAANMRKFTIFGQCSSFLPSSMTPICFLLIGFPEPEQWLLPFPAKLVENDKTFFGYYLSWMMQFSGGFNYMIIFCILMSMEIGLCTFIDVCLADMRQIIEGFNKKIDDRLKTKTELSQAIQLHQHMLKYIILHHRRHFTKIHFKILFWPSLESWTTSR